MHKFDPDHLLKELSSLNTKQRATFAACCAARNFEFLRQLSVGRSSPEPLRSSCDALRWIANSITSTALNRLALDQVVSACEEHAPTEDDASSEGVPYAADTCRMVIYALLQFGSSENDADPAFYAAQAAYEIVSDQEQRRLPDGIVSKTDGTNILASKAVQDELKRQRNDLMAVQRHGKDLGGLLSSRLSACC